MTQHEEMENPSFLLGTFCATLQRLEKLAFPDHEEKGTRWSEDALLMFRVNAESTIQLIGELLKKFPDKLYEDNTVYLVSDVIQLYQKIGIQYFVENPVDEPEFIKGYQSKIFDYYDEAEEIEDKADLLPTCEADELNFLIGTMAAKIQYLLESAHPKDPPKGAQYIEDVYLLLHTNVGGTMRIFEHTLEELPETAIIGGFFVTALEVKTLYLYIGRERLRALELNLDFVRKGYQMQCAHFGKPTE